MSVMAASCDGSAMSWQCHVMAVPYEVQMAVSHDVCVMHCLRHVMAVLGKL